MVKKAMIERHAEPRETEQATCTICMESNATVKI